MPPTHSSLYRQAVVTSVVVLTVMVVLAAGTILAMLLVNRQTRALEQEWMAEATLLGDIDHSVSAFRLAEAYRGLAQNAAARQAAEAMAAGQAQNIDTVLQQDGRLLRHQAPAGLGRFSADWTRYRAMHDAWVRADRNGANPLPAQTAQLARQYSATDAAIGALIDTHNSAGQARAGLIGRIVRITIGVVAALALMMVLVTMRATLAIRRRLIGPLESITHTMTLLAAGRHETAVPAMNRPDEIGDMARACEVFRVNVAALAEANRALRSAEAQAQKLARHDALTGLPNRRVFSANLQTTIEHSQRDGSTYSVLLIDLDGFKKVNDLLGHHVGDMVLCKVAQRLESGIAKQDTLARLGGDEFAVIAPDAAGMDAHMARIKQLAGRLIRAIGQEMRCDGNVIDVGASIGIAPQRDSVTEVSSVLHAADIAMYRAKKSGRGAFRFFEQSMDDALRAQETLERDLMRAVAAGEIRPYYQPLVDIETSRIRGFEALARWKHTAQGFIPPDVFIPIVERLGLMTKFTASILHQACQDARMWPESTRVAVNFPPSEFQDPELPRRIQEILAAEEFPATRLEIEITENALLGDVEAARANVTALQGLGIAICLDDFGTGYSSLNHLRELKFDKVKIDRSFVQSMGDSVDHEKIIDAILGLTKSLGLPAVAEGIENAFVLNKLRLKGCEYGQGYYFARPVSAEAARQMILLGSKCPATA